MNFTVFPHICIPILITSWDLTSDVLHHLLRQSVRMVGRLSLKILVVGFLVLRDRRLQTKSSVSSTNRRVKSSDTLYVGVNQVSFGHLEIRILTKFVLWDYVFQFI